MGLVLKTEQFGKKADFGDLDTDFLGGLGRDVEHVEFEVGDEDLEAGRGVFAEGEFGAAHVHGELVDDDPGRVALFPVVHGVGSQELLLHVGLELFLAVSTQILEHEIVEQLVGTEFVGFDVVVDPDAEVNEGDDPVADLGLDFADLHPGVDHRLVVAPLHSLAVGFAHVDFHGVSLDDEGPGGGVGSQADVELEGLESDPHAGDEGSGLVVLPGKLGGNFKLDVFDVDFLMRRPQCGGGGVGRGRRPRCSGLPS